MAGGSRRPGRRYWPRGRPGGRPAGDARRDGRHVPPARRDPGCNRLPQGQGARIGHAQAPAPVPAQPPGPARGAAAARHPRRRAAHGEAGGFPVGSPRGTWGNPVLKRFRKRLPGLVAGTLLAVAMLPAHAADPHVLVLGRISDDPKAHYEQLKPLLDYVVPRMADVGITEGRILMARDMQQMNSYLRRGRVDWVTETSANAMRLQERAGAEPLLLTERNGVGTYRSVTFVRHASGIRSLEIGRAHV